MLWNAATTELLSFFKTKWEAARPGTPIHYPATAPVSPGADGSWGRLSIMPSYSKRIAVGGQLRQQGGVIVVNMFVPIGFGDTLAVTLDGIITTIWDGARDNGLNGEIHLDAPMAIPGIRDPDTPNLWRAGVSVPFVVYHAP